MTRFTSLLAAVAVIATSAPALAQSGAAEARLDAAQRRFDNEVNIYRQAVDEYRNAARRNDYRPGGQGGYYDPRQPYPADYDWQGSYRPSNSGQRYLTRDDTIYYGSDNRAYCRRSDGTTGLVVGAALGGVLGNVVDGGRQRTLGTLLGGAGGALLGRSIEQQPGSLPVRRLQARSKVILPLTGSTAVSLTDT